jgi:ribosomal protein L37AE/L43A
MEYKDYISPWSDDPKCPECGTYTRIVEGLNECQNCGNKFDCMVGGRFNGIKVFKEFAATKEGQESISGLLTAVSRTSKRG